MAREKQSRRMIAMALAAAVTMSSVPVVAFAEGEGSNPGSEGSSETGKVTVTVTQDKENNTTTTTKETNISTNEKSEDGTKETDYKGQKTETKVEKTDEDSPKPGEPVSTPTTETDVNDDEDEKFDSSLEDDELSKSQKTDETTTTVEKTEDGTTTTVKNEKTENSVDAEGNIFESEVTNTEVIKHDADGKWVETSGEEVREETKTTDQDGVEMLGDEADIAIPMIKDGETLPADTPYSPITEVDDNIVITTTTTVEEDETTGAITTTVTKVMTETTGDVNSSDGQTTVRAEREVSVTTQGEMVKITTGDGLVAGTGDSILDVYDGDGMIDMESLKVVKEAGMQDVSGYGNPISSWQASADADWAQRVEDGTADTGYIYAPVLYGHISDYSVLAYGNGKDWVNQVQLKNYQDPDDPYHFVYCLDMNTDTKPGGEGGWYQMENLEDADYVYVKYEDGEEVALTEDEAEVVRQHLSYIAKNGYWGTTNEGKEVTVENEDGTTTTKTEYATGSLNAMKEMLKAEQAKGALVGVDVDALTDGEALVATQMAIWMYGHSQEQAEEGFQATLKMKNRKETDEAYAERMAATVEARERINAIAAFLASGVDAEKTETEVITEKNFVESMEVVVGDKLDEFLVDGENVNADTNEDNDAYEVSLKFALAVDIDDESGDMVLKVVNEKGDVVAQKTIADTDKNVEETTGNWTVENGNYTVSGLQLQENSNSKFSLTLEGIQHLEQGVYIYSAENAEDSQTLIGLAEGERVVDLEASVDMNFNVKEGKVTTTRTWKKTWHETPSGGGGENPPGGGDNPPDGGTDIPDSPVPMTDIPEPPIPTTDVPGESVDIVDEEPPLADIPEEEVPLVAATGDSNHMTAGFGGMLAALAGMFMLRRKKEQ